MLTKEDIINRVKQLKNGSISIDLSNMNLTEIHDLSIYADKLVKLDLRHNRINKIEKLNTLINLKELLLSSNKITKIEELDTLTNLQKLSLSYNEITKIEGLDTLTNLHKLDLSHTKITKIPQSILNLINLRKFYYLGNPKNYISPNIVRFLDQRTFQTGTLRLKKIESSKNESISTNKT